MKNKAIHHLHVKQNNNGYIKRVMIITSTLVVFLVNYGKGKLLNSDQLHVKYYRRPQVTAPSFFLKTSLQKWKKILRMILHFERGLFKETSSAPPYI